MPALPLLSNLDLETVIAVHGGERVTTARFVAQAEALARQLPDKRHLIHLAGNRYLFLLGWVAACLRGQVMLLPSNQGAATLTELRGEFPDSHVFDDTAALSMLGDATGAATALPDWTLPVDRVVAIVFTSGSTGRPEAHAKTWGSLFHNSRLAARDVLGGMARNVVATVPSQHMYGLEASLLVSLTAGCCSFDSKPFFPADVRAALAAMPEPRMLVTTPAHLRVLTAAGVDLPAVHRVVSATAPLPAELARQAELLWNTEVFEIYGCTEAGVMAHRRTTRSQRWRTLAGGVMVSVDGAAEYRAPQLPNVVPLPDVIESHGDTEFTLLGRANDMIKVAGKRSSLQELTRKLLSIPGVEDGAIFVPDGEERPAAIAVAPGLTTAQILAGLREILEPVFVPRPLVLVEKLPRNDLGKLPREAMQRALAQVDNTGVIRIPADHPSLAGHFPGNPLVPAVVLLDAVLAHIAGRRPGMVGRLPSVKFLSPVRPGESIRLDVEFTATSARFSGSRADARVFEGSLVFTDAEPA
jgi:acyl-CoA synthetase (AMP-forming)/AMP-acid ligase II